MEYVMHQRPHPTAKANSYFAYKAYSGLACAIVQVSVWISWHDLCHFLGWWLCRQNGCFTGASSRKRLHLASLLCEPAQLSLPSLPKHLNSAFQCLNSAWTVPSKTPAQCLKTPEQCQYGLCLLWCQSQATFASVFLSLCGAGGTALFNVKINRQVDK